MRRLTDLLASDELDGYQPAPAAYGALDGPGLAHATCERCGHEGLTYRGFTRPGSYRAFAVCPACGGAQEF